MHSEFSVGAKDSGDICVARLQARDTASNRRAAQVTLAREWAVDSGLLKSGNFLIFSAPPAARIERGATCFLLCARRRTASAPGQWLDSLAGTLGEARRGRRNHTRVEIGRASCREIR